jgi:dCTP diphosphatase
MTDSNEVIRKMQERIVTFNTERDWNQFHTPKDLALSLVLESAEVLEHFQWKNEAEMRDHLKKHKDDVGEELCDSLYWILLMAHYFDVDLTQAFEKKMQKNEKKYPIEKAKGSHKKYTEYQEETAA